MEEGSKREHVMTRRGEVKSLRISILAWLALPFLSACGGVPPLDMGDIQRAADAGGTVRLSPGTYLLTQTGVVRKSRSSGNAMTPNLFGPLWVMDNDPTNQP